MRSRRSVSADTTGPAYQTSAAMNTPTMVNASTTLASIPASTSSRAPSAQPTQITGDSQPTKAGACKQRLQPGQEGLRPSQPGLDDAGRQACRQPLGQAEQGDRLTGSVARRRGGGFQLGRCQPGKPLRGQVQAPRRRGPEDQQQTDQYPCQCKQHALLPGLLPDTHAPMQQRRSDLHGAAGGD